MYTQLIIDDNKPQKPLCKRSQLAAQQFIDRITFMEGIVIGKYVNAHVKVECRCKHGHSCAPLPLTIQKGDGMCSICAGRNSKSAAAFFVKRIHELGGRLIAEYIHSHSPVECICINGHTCTPTPTNVQKGNGICTVCSNTNFNAAKNNFLEIIKQRGGTVIGQYKGCKVPIEIKCKLGHISYPSPGNISMGRGICFTCSGMNPEASEIKFLEDITKLGGKVIGQYKDSHSYVECICKNNHQCSITPTYVREGGGMCRQCTFSKGEVLVTNTLNHLQIPFEYQIHHPSLKRLKFDFRFVYDNKIYYLEFDGIQHHIEIPHFHRSSKPFEMCRQKDIIKNYTVNHTLNNYLIRIDYRWIDNKLTMYQLGDYILRVIDSKIKVYGDPHLYTWINDTPTMDTYNKYIISNEDIQIKDHNSEEDSDDDDDIDNIVIARTNVNINTETILIIED
jgi:hypothetical protein